MKRFALIGDGQVARYHRKAIEHVGGEIVWIVDPRHEDRSLYSSQLPVNLEANHRFYRKLMDTIDYYVICSPSQFHRSQIQYLLSNLNSTWKEFQIICEKPAFLPWEPPIISDKINIVLQLRYLPNLPERAESVVAHFVRDEDYFKSWKGDPKNTGGLFYNLFIHYIYLAIQLGADFEGSVSESGYQARWIDTTTGDSIDILDIDNQACYNLLYEDILSGGGIKPKDIFYLSWVLARNSELFGYGKGGIGKTIRIGRDLL